MIKNIIFDFGDIFINLDKAAPINAFLELGLTTPIKEVNALNELYEVGNISTEKFLSQYKKWLPNAYEYEIVSAWDSILKDFPKYRLEFLQKLKAENKYRLFLLSNTNNLHIDNIKKTVPFFKEFKDCFEVFYLSQEMHLRKPNDDIFEFVLNNNSLVAKETIFIDDTKENTDTASKLGMQTWNLQPGKEDVIDLFKIKANLF